MKIRVLLFFSLVFCIFSVKGQELNCTVQVNSSQIQSSDKKIFETLQNSLVELMNTRHWTSDQYLNQERIECSILINIVERISNDEFKATIQVQSVRPVYKSSYNSPMLNFLDNDFNFRYLEFQQLEFQDNNHLSNLTSVLAFYAYLIIGLDYDSFSPDGGTPLFLKAQNIVANAQSAVESGWKAFESTKNRYWIIENLLNPSFKPLRETLYRYHRLGLDNMADNKENARAAITESLDLLKKVFADRPGSLLLQMFFNAKTDEIIKVYAQQAFPEEKSRVVNTLNMVDPSNSSKYQEILK
jgi:hypothetical protein